MFNVVYAQMADLRMIFDDGGCWRKRWTFDQIMDRLLASLKDKSQGKTYCFLTYLRRFFSPTADSIPSLTMPLNISFTLATAIKRTE